MTTAKTSRKSDTFTAALTRSFKGSCGRYICAKDEDGTIYATNGFFLVKLTAAEYDALIRPVTLTDAGNWSQSGEGTRPTEPGKGLDLVDYWRKATEDPNAKPLQPSGLTLTTQGARKSKPAVISLFYCAEADFVSGYNPDYLGIVAGATTYKAAGITSPMTIYTGDTPAAVVMPIKVDNAASLRAVRAFFNSDGPTDAAALEVERDTFRRELDGARGQVRELSARVLDLQDKLDQASTAPASADDPAPAHKLDDLTAAVAALGLSYTVKGQQTAAPVIWVDGDPGDKKADLEALGAKWSGKRSAWYLKA